MSITAFEIQRYGDFDMLYTDCIMVSDETHLMQGLINIFEHKEGIKLNKELPKGKETVYIDKFKTFLKKRGFRELKTKQVTFTDS